MTQPARQRGLGPTLPARLWRIWRRQPMLAGAFTVALALCLFFAAQASLRAWHWHRLEAERPLAGWMTPRYVAHSWRVPREVMQEALGELPPPGRGRPTLRRIAADQGVPLEDLVGRIEAAVVAYRAGGG